ncbi:hypothetical protein BOX15_Mlig023397g1, partial [Macrostomum lignano]
LPNPSSSAGQSARSQLWRTQPLSEQQRNKKKQQQGLSGFNRVQAVSADFVADVGDLPPLLNDILLRAVFGEPATGLRVPLWLLRQAGPHLPEYRQLLAHHGHAELCRNPELASELTVLPLTRCELDAAPIFTDIILVPIALGLVAKQSVGGVNQRAGLIVSEPLTGPADRAALALEFGAARGRLHCVLEALNLARRRLMGRAVLLGLAGAPWTLLARMAGDPGLAVGWLYSQPEACERLLDKLTGLLVDFLVDQVAAGAQALQVVEPLAGRLSPNLFCQFALPRLRRLASEVRARIGPGVPLILFAPSCHSVLEELACSGFDVLGVDHTMRPEHCRRVAAAAGVAVQGNLDPALLAYAPSEVLRDHVRRMLRAFGAKRYVCNVGAGLLPETPPERLAELTRLVRLLVEDLSSKNE